MACTEEKPILKQHYCRICNKGFMCGRALGGHMRAHGFEDESGNVDEDDQISDWEDKQYDHRSSSTSNSRRNYQLRTNPNRLKSCRVCENCGKEFSSWKSFLEHGKCNNSEDAESLVSSPSPGSDLDGEYELEGGGGGRRRRSCQWSKRKRSLRTKVGSFNSSAAYPSSGEDEDLLLAKCLVDLANARFETHDDQPEESCASANREEEIRRNPVTTTFLAPSPSPSRPAAAATTNNNYNKSGSTKGLFECKACKKVFNSHQALGGHRASHKKVKGCYAAKQEQVQIQVQVDDSMIGDEDAITHDQEFFPSKSASSSLQFEQGSSKWSTGSGRRKSKVHECTICHRIFSTGQALGGHKRCHWMTSNTQFQDSKNVVVQLQDDDQMVDQVHHHQAPPPSPSPPPPINDDDKKEGLDLNLNLPATHHHHHNNQGVEMKRDPQNPLSFEVYTGIRLDIWSNNNNNNSNNNNNNNTAETEAKNNDDHDRRRNQNNGGDVEETKVIMEDEADSKVKLEKLSELKGINISGNSSPWLQVGIGNSATDIAAAP